METGFFLNRFGFKFTNYHLAVVSNKSIHKFISATKKETWGVLGPWIQKQDVVSHQLVKKRDF